MSKYQEEKSHVGMGVSVCPVCGCEHDEVVLLDKHLRKTLTRHMFNGWAMCAEHAKMKDDGYIALVEVSNTSTPTLENAQRTGTIAHIRSTTWPHIFNVPAPEKGLCFVEPGVVQQIQKISEQSQ